MLGGDLAGGGVDDAGGDGEGPVGGDAGAGKVDLCQALKVLEDGLGGAVGEQQADGAGEVLGQVLDARGDGLGGGLAEGLAHELGLAEEEAAVGEVAADVLEVVVAHVVDAEDEAVLVLGDGIADILEELVLLLARLLGNLREVVDLGALGLGHGCGCGCAVPSRLGVFWFL